MPLPIKIPDVQFNAWDKLISRFMRAGARPRIKFKTLQTDRDHGGLALPNLKEYYLAAHLRNIVCWCFPAVEGQWKQIELSMGKSPPQTRLVEKSRISNLNNHIVENTLLIWHEVVNKYNLGSNIKILSWPSCFLPGRLDPTFSCWIK